MPATRRNPVVLGSLRARRMTGPECRMCDLDNLGEVIEVNEVYWLGYVDEDDEMLMVCVDHGEIHPKLEDILLNRVWDWAIAEFGMHQFLVRVDTDDGHWKAHITQREVNNGH